MQTIRKNVVVRGRVQGVGFRYTTQMLAHRYAVNGWVRNEPDGSVQIEAQGKPAEVEAFLSAIRGSRVGSGIEQWDLTDRPAEHADHRGFEVAYA